MENQDPTKTKFVIEGSLIQALGAYLGRQPYLEVAELIQKLASLERCKESTE